MALTSLHAVANAPMFSYLDAYLGRGIVGGPLISVKQAAGVAVRILCSLFSLACDFEQIVW
jgi:hypothetical protein